MKNNTVDFQALSKKAILIPAIIFMFIAVGLYIQTWNYEFVLDDKIVITENEFTLKGFDGIADILGNESFVGYFKEQKDLVEGSRYRPLSLITFAIEKELVGQPHSGISHVINYIMYGLSGLILFLCLHRLFPVSDKWYFSIAFLTTVLWLVHAVHVEIVANVKGRDEILALFFTLLSFLNFFHFYDSKKSNQVLNLSLGALFFFLGLLAKESTVTFFAVIPLSYYFFRNVQWKRLWISLGVMGVTFGIYMIIRLNAVGFLFSGKEVTDIMNNPYYGIDFGNKMAMIFLVMLKYLGLSAVPYPLTHDYYPYQIPVVSFTNIAALFSVIVYVFLAIFSIYKLKSKNVWSYLILFFLATISIYSNVVFNIGTTMNERFLYMSTIPTSIALVYGIKYFFKSRKESILPVIIIGIIAMLYALISFTRIPVWENTLTLNSSAVKVSTNSARANSFMGTALFNEGNEETNRTKKLALYNEANQYVTRALEIYPEYYNGNKMKAGIAAEIYKQNRNLSALLKSFYEVASVKPEVGFLYEYYDYLENRASRSEMLGYYIKLTKEGLFPRRNYGFAAKTLLYALKLDPNNAEVNYLMGMALKGVGKESHAQSYISKALSLDPYIESKVKL